MGIPRKKKVLTESPPEIEQDSGLLDTIPNVPPIQEPVPPEVSQSDTFSSFEDLVSWFSEAREGLLHAHLLYEVHLVDFKPFHLTIRLSQKAPKDLPLQLQNLLKKKRDEVWTIAISDEIGHPTLHEQEQKAQEERRTTILQDPLVKSLKEAFPEATLLEIKEI